MSLEKLEAEDQVLTAATILAGPNTADALLVYQRAAELGDHQGVRIAAEAWVMGASAMRNSLLGRRICRICGCWELEACVGGCSWVEEDLCSACVGKGAAPSGLPAVVQMAWQSLLEKDDRTSPEARPDMMLITRDELADCMERAAADPATHTARLDHLLRLTRWYLADALEAYEHSDGRALLRQVDAILAERQD